ncbi:MAG: hypothetical protein LUQ65_10270 [Candidatus Helarchaeota archaeon]|nr:hypothetical protein [Candidatus Helarchaeota archaeon]
MEELLKEILQEMKWHSTQNDKIIGLLGKLRQPCGGQNQLAGMMKILDGIPEMAKKSNPGLGEMINQMKDLVKESQR